MSGSLESSGVRQTSSGAEAEVRFETPSYNTGTWSGETVLEVALESSVPHGGYAGGTYKINIKNDYIEIVSSNTLEAPNDRVLFNEIKPSVTYRNVKTGEESTKDITNIYCNEKIYY